jgi:hypothetical protein
VRHRRSGSPSQDPLFLPGIRFFKPAFKLAFKFEVCRQIYRFGPKRWCTVILSKPLVPIPAPRKCSGQEFATLIFCLIIKQCSVVVDSSLWLIQALDIYLLTIQYECNQNKCCLVSQNGLLACPMLSIPSFLDIGCFKLSLPYTQLFLSLSNQPFAYY